MAYYLIGRTYRGISISELRIFVMTKKKKENSVIIDYCFMQDKLYF